MNRPRELLEHHWERVRAARADLLTARVGVEDLAAELSACRAELASMRAELAALSERVERDRGRSLDALRMVRDHDADAWRALWRLRASDEYAAAFEEDEPLVSIVMATWSNWRLMRERALPSLLAQTYERFECIVVGDAAPPEADQAVRSFGDARLRFVNLPYRGPYPENELDAWRVSGTTPSNTGLALARGRWILYAGDDDSMRPTCIASLLELARERRAEVPYGKFAWHRPDGESEVRGLFPPEHGHWAAQCSLIHAGLRFIPAEPSDWLFEVPNDWSMADRMLRIGVRFAMLDEPVVDYYPSRLWKDRA